MQYVACDLYGRAGRQLLRLIVSRRGGYDGRKEFSMKYNHYVVIIESDNHVKYVTSINRENKCAIWKSGEAAMKFSKTAAEDLVFGLVANGFQAAVLRAPSFMEPANN